MKFENCDLTLGHIFIYKDRTFVILFRLFILLLLSITGWARIRDGRQDPIGFARLHL